MDSLRITAGQMSEAQRIIDKTRLCEVLLLVVEREVSLSMLHRSSSKQQPTAVLGGP
jgi:hypothetical protein